MSRRLANEGILIGNSRVLFEKATPFTFHLLPITFHLLLFAPLREIFSLSSVRRPGSLDSPGTISPLSRRRFLLSLSPVYQSLFPE